MRVFDREQVVYIVNLALGSALDRVESCVPPCVSVEEAQATMNDGHLAGFAHGAAATAGMMLASFYARMTGNGMSISDALGLIDFEDFLFKFVERRIAEARQTPPLFQDYYPPSTKSFAEKFVTEVMGIKP